MDRYRKERGRIFNKIPQNPDSFTKKVLRDLRIVTLTSIIIVMHFKLQYLKITT